MIGNNPQTPKMPENITKIIQNAMNGEVELPELIIKLTDVAINSK